MSLAIFSKNLRTLRKQSNLSQKQLGLKIHASRSLIAQIERGSKIPNLWLAERIAATFEQDLTTLTTLDLAA